jgi:hypothetical protein
MPGHISVQEIVAEAMWNSDLQHERGHRPATSFEREGKYPFVFS